MKPLRDFYIFSTILFYKCSIHRINWEFTLLTDNLVKFVTLATIGPMSQTQHTLIEDSMLQVYDLFGGADSKTATIVSI
jgi:hypothetical protein